MLRRYPDVTSYDEAFQLAYRDRVVAGPDGVEVYIWYEEDGSFGKTYTVIARTMTGPLMRFTWGFTNRAETRYCAAAAIKRVQARGLA